MWAKGKFLLKSMENTELSKTINVTAGNNNFYISFLYPTIRLDAIMIIGLCGPLWKGDIEGRSFICSLCNFLSYESLAVNWCSYATICHWTGENEISSENLLFDNPLVFATELFEKFSPSFLHQYSWKWVQHSSLTGEYTCCYISVCGWIDPSYM